MCTDALLSIDSNKQGGNSSNFLRFAPPFAAIGPNKKGGVNVSYCKGRTILTPFCHKLI